ncbi:alpha-galactosidase [Lactobacillus mulieris]|uniref:alpha-galactosidase n=1 Tax=Lactobacillus mulieris TaxID=2508708 RepID=UPI0036F47A08
MIYVIEKNDEKYYFLNTNNTSIVLLKNKYDYLFILHWGSLISPTNLDYVLKELNRASYLADANGVKDFKLEQMPQIYPSYGYSDLREPAFSIRYQDGSRITDLRYDSYKIYKTKKKLKGLPTIISKESESIDLILIDKIKKIKITLTFSVFDAYDAITQSVKIENLSNETCYIEKVCSASIDLLFSDLDMFQLNGAWGRECHINKRHLVQGYQSISSARGASGHGQNPFIALATRGTNEEYGEIFALNFVYSGNFLGQVEVDMHKNTRVQLGINPFDFEWILDPSQSFQTPEVVMVYSNEGLGKMSRIFHKLYRNTLASRKYLNSTPPILLNSWEANYFDFTKESLLNLAEKSSEIGVELFVIDDGWFAKRNDTTSSIGDWVPNQVKLGGNLDTLINKIKKNKIKFGLWFEPEMVSPNSNLYRLHPEWVIQVKNRRIEESRDEYVLDLSNPAVCEYITEILSNFLSVYSIDYVKWDMNRNFTNLGSTYLSSERQKEQAHRYILGLYSILENLTKRFPNVIIEGCAGGGGRCDPGMLYYMQQIWISDDTDAIERLPIQYGTSLIYPSVSLGCHISAVPNHQTNRITNLDTRSTVAMWGNLGLELDLNNLRKDELEILKNKILFYKKIRSIVQLGDLYRLQGLDETNEYAWMYISEKQDEILVSYVQIMAQPNTVAKRLRIPYLDVNFNYLDVENNRVYKGDELYALGVSKGSCKYDGYSKQWLFRRI